MSLKQRSVSGYRITEIQLLGQPGVLDYLAMPFDQFCAVIHQLFPALLKSVMPSASNSTSAPRATSLLCQK